MIRFTRYKSTAILFVCAAFLLIASVVTWAQQQINTGLYGTPNASVKYGWGAGYSTPATVNLMPSENRNLYYTSNGTPSAVRANMAKYGALPPAGFVQYLPEPGVGYKVGSVGTTGNYVNTSLAPQPVGNMGGIPGVPGAGSVRYSGAAPLPRSAVGYAPSASYAARPVGGVAAAPTGAAMPSGYRMSGSVRYGG